LQGDLSKELISLLRINKITPNTVPVEKLNRITHKNHQGVIAYTSPVDFYDTDARNFGAIIRTAECVGVHGIVITKSGSAPVSADTIKTSAGAVFNMPICKVSHLKDAIFLLQSCVKLPTAIVMGSEGTGVSSGILKVVDQKAKLPMFGEISSLNVSVAAGAFLYEATRQRISK